MNRDLRRALDDEPMRPFQWLAVAVCIVLNLIDGFDVLVMAFTASSVAAEWNLGGAEIGLLLSAGLFGMAAGSLFIAPWADRWGRRPLILACLALSGLGMLASALSQAAWQLALLRGLTGLGIGGILASSNVIASEYASRRWRGLAVSLQSTGYALGATLGGLLAVWLIGAWGWRSVFVFGAGLTLAVIPLVCLCLPESLDFLLARRRGRCSGSTRWPGAWAARRSPNCRARLAAERSTVAASPGCSASPSDAPRCCSGRCSSW